MLAWIVSLLLLATSDGNAVSHKQALQDAEAAYAEKSYARAHLLFTEMSREQLTDEERPWVEFRLADTSWRGGIEQQKAMETLSELVRSHEGNRDRVWAEAEESLADAGGNGDYEKALEWWGSSTDLPLATRRFLDIVFKIASPPRYGSNWYEQGSINSIPREIPIRALKVATTKEDIAHLRFILAQQLLIGARPEDVERAFELFDSILREGKATSWYDDALLRYAQELENQGDVVLTEQSPIRKPDYVKAIELYRRLIADFAPGESRFVGVAQYRISEIKKPRVEITSAQRYLAGSEEELFLSWRNVGSAEITISRIDLQSDLRYDRSIGDIGKMVTPKDRPVIRRWTETLHESSRYAPGLNHMRVTPKLDAGAYQVIVNAEGTVVATVMIVSNATIALHGLGSTADVYVSDVLRGAPLRGAHLHGWYGTREVSAVADERGFARIALPSGESTAELFLAATAGNQQATLSTYVYPRWRAEQLADWRIYAFTDRPAYRPDETVHWKFIARTRNRDESWSTPAGEELQYEIIEPGGNKVAEGTAKLNEFGSDWGELALTPAMKLGSYSIRLFTKAQPNLGFAPLFQVEEYKLPEYTVSLNTPGQYRLGDTVRAEIDARYYFGGAVSNATVKASVNRGNYVRSWYDSAWFLPPMPGYWGGGGENVLTETLTTDASGHATIEFETHRDLGDSAYSINVCVSDASRREVCRAGTIVVTQQRYAVRAKPQHSIGSPDQKMSVDFIVVDNRDQPVKTAGTVKVMRREWCRTNCKGYQDFDVAGGTVETNASGVATFTFTPRREGYYSVSWSSEDRTAGQPLRSRDIVKAETSLWVTRDRTTDLGYHSEGIQLILDRDAVRTGDRERLIIATDSSDRWVMLTIYSSEIIETRILHLDGSVLPIELPIDQRYAPDFAVTTTSTFNRQLHTSTKGIKVPALDRMLTVEVKSDRDEYRPRQKGTVTVTTRDFEGKPVRAEVALAVSDESVTAIAADFAVDPRRFFYGDTRVESLEIAASAAQWRYANLKVGKDGKLVDDAVAPIPAELLTDEEPLGWMALNARRHRVSEAITVTASSPAVLQESAPRGIEIIVRNDFRSTAFWKPDVMTDATGTATITLDYPEALTEWRATARAITPDSRVGMSSSSARTSLPLLVRLESPRFFVAGDRSVVSAVINNNSDEPKSVTPSLEATGIVVTSQSPMSVQVPAHGEARADWVISADRAGTATLRVRAASDVEGDAMERSLTVYEHGIDKLVARSGKVRSDKAVIALTLPPARRDTSLVVNVSPSLAASMLDALPYLIDYPYGCTEQTMSRFLPASVVARTLVREHLARPAWMSRLDAVTAQSIDRLYDFQHGDGGWGWWKEDESEAFMTAYVVWGFAVAKEAEIGVDAKRIDLAVDWLDRRLVDMEQDPQAQTWMLHALAMWRHASHEQETEFERRAFDRVWTSRERLSSYSRALLALTARDFGDGDRAEVLVRNLENGVMIDRSPDRSVLIGNESTPSPAETMATAHWGANQFWWRWYESPVEATAFSLEAIVTIDPVNKLIEPAMNWLVRNRRGARWNNTRDTAIALLALDDYLRASGEVPGTTSYQLEVNGLLLGSTSEASHFVIPQEFVKDANVITIRKLSGSGPLYFSAEARFVSLEEPVKPAGHELFTKRQYLRQIPRKTLLNGVQYEEVPLRDGEALASGDRVVVVATIETKNDYDYLLFEDLKPAGLEATSLNSGGAMATRDDGRTAYVYQELRDRKIATFASHLEQGTWTIRYQLRAETPGSFHALPLVGEAMYVPEVRANSEEQHVVVE